MRRWSWARLSLTAMAPLLAPFVDFKNSPGFGGVVDDIAELGDGLSGARGVGVTVK